MFWAVVGYQVQSRMGQASAAPHGRWFAERVTLCCTEPDAKARMTCCPSCRVGDHHYESWCIAPGCKDGRRDEMDWSNDTRKRFRFARDGIRKFVGLQEGREMVRQSQGA